MSQLQLQTNTQTRTTLIQVLLVSGGFLLIVYTLIDWLTLERTLYTGYTERHFHDYIIFLGWLFFSLSFYLLRSWVFKEGLLLRKGVLAISVGLFFITFAYFFNGWIDGISFPGFVITYYPGTLITSLGIIGCIFSPINSSQFDLPLSKSILIVILLLLLLSCFLPIYYFSSNNDKSTATIIRSIGHILLGAVFIVAGFLLKKNNIRNNA